MDNITNSEEAKTDQRIKKGVSAKKKSKKAKETVENLDKSAVVTEEVIEHFKDKVSLHSNNGLTNGTSNDHSDEDARKNDNHDSSENCERFNDTETKRDDLEISLSKVQLASEPVEVDCLEKTVDSDAKVSVECSECKEIACATPGAINFESYRSELQMAEIMRLIQKDLSEPYSIYTYRYFIHNWPKLCFLAMHNNKCIGAIVCKLDVHRKKVKRGYIAMLAVDEKYRKRKIGSHLVRQAIMVMVSDDADEVVLETEITNKPALRLYENLGFVRDKRLFRYYLNGVDALRLKLWLR